MQFIIKLNYNTFFQKIKPFLQHFLTIPLKKMIYTTIL